MPINCIWFPEQPDCAYKPGWVFPFGYYLSDHYLSNVAPIRPPISVVVPTRQGGATAFCIDSYPTSNTLGAWAVDCPWPLEPGEKPLISVHPSIHCHGIWHGYLTAGVLSDDIPG